MVELLPETAGKSSEIASVILSLSTAPNSYSWLKIFQKERKLEEHCKLSSEDTLYLIHPLTL